MLGSGRVLVTALAGLLAAEPAPQNPYLASALRLYNDLEFQAALEQLHQAEQKSTSPSDDVVIHTYEGIVEYNLSQPEQAEEDFKVALSLDLGAQLPNGVSPKIRALWERVRAGLARPHAPSPEAAPEPKAPEAKPPEASASGPSGAKPELKPELSHRESPAGGLTLHIPAIAVAGGGVVVGATGLVLGLVARSTGQAAQRDPFQSDAAAHLDAAQRQQVAAWTLLSAGGAALLTGGAMYLLGQAESQARADASTRPAAP